MATVGELTPGDVVDGAIFIARTTHPIWPNLQLVVWRMSDRSISLDALRSNQHVGSVTRAGLIRQALLDDSQW